MEIQRNEIGNLHEAINITLERSDYMEQVEKSLRKIRQHAQINGFRPGKAPMALISKLYKKAVILDEVEKIIQQRIMDYIKEQNIDTLGTPILSENNFNAVDVEDEPTFKLTFELGIRPQVEIKLSKKDKVPVYKIQVDEDSVNKYLDYYKKIYGQNIDVEESTENSILKGEVYDNNDPSTMLNTDGVILLSVVQDKKIKKQFIGKKVGNEVIFDAFKAFPNKKDLSLLINKKEEELPESLTLRYIIKSINEFKEAELNQELWNKIYGENVVNSYEEFVDKIKQEIKAYRDEESQYKLKSDVRKKLLSKIQVDLPELFLKRQLKENSRKELSDEVIESEFPIYLEAVKEQLIYAAIQREHNIQVTEQDMLEGAKEVVKNQFKQYGIYSLPEEYVNNLASKVLKNEKEADRIYQAKLEEKILDVVKNLVTLEEKEISYEDFIKKLKEEK